MADERVRVFIEDHTGNKRREAKIAAHATVSDLIPAIFRALDLPATDAAGRPVTYHLAFRDRQLQADETLASAGIIDGANITLVPVMTAGCFLAGTQVLLPGDGRRVLIEDLKEGDEILSYSIQKRVLTSSRVVSIFKGSAPTYLEFNGFLKVTPSHLLYVNNCWQRAENIRVGDTLFNHAEESVSVTHVSHCIKIVDVYNLSLGNDGTFFADGILVHNLEAKILSFIAEQIRDIREFGNPSLIMSHFGGEYVSVLSPEIVTLHNLKELDWSYNELTTLPQEVTRLRNLETLNLRGNKFVRLPPRFFELSNIRFLDLSENQITQFPIDIVKLTSLEHLNLSGNHLTKLPIELGGLPNLQEIRIDGNPLQFPPLEIARQGTEAIKNYLATSSEVRKLYEAKMIIVGEGAVGKTSLVNKLIEGDFDIERHADLIKTTEGVEVIPWFFDTATLQDFRVNIWDFGGQEIYHATHQFFLTKRSLYLFVWDARKEDRLGGFDYWLNIIKLLSAASPVIVVLNKSDERVKEIDQAGLKEKFPNILCFLRVSALTGQGMNELTSQIKNCIIKLPHVGNDWPRTWAEIRYKLETDKRDYIDYQEFLFLCSQFGLAQEQASFLGDYLHDLGVILHFRDDPILRNIVILKMGWGTDALYQILDTKHIQDNKGRFRFSDLGNVWSNERYPADTHIELLQLLIKFELCFKLMDAEEYIVPELLSPAKPEFTWDNCENLQFEYHYDFMPAGILTRFIVRNHAFVKENVYWRYGVILEHEESVALVTSEPLDKRIKILIRGSSNKELLAIIRHDFDCIHQTLNNPKVKEMIPCTCKECKLTQPYVYNFWNLKKFSSKKITSFPCPNSAENVSVAELLEGLPDEMVEVRDVLKSSTTTEAKMDSISVLFLSADPTSASRLRVGEELREIQEKLQLAKQRERFNLQQRMSVRPADISQALLDVQPQIVHFSGHGTPSGALCFENQVGEIHPIQSDALAALFEQFSHQVNGIILNACYSETQANAIANYIDYVIGMKQAIGDKAAIAFSIGFYQALGAGRTIEEAYKLGCVQIRLQGIAEHLTPVLVKKKQA